jgi:hypothetical protein
MNAMPRRDDAMLDGLLTRLESYRSELANGMTNHAPMVVEALVQLGRAEIADAWLDAYLEGALSPVVASAALPAGDWRSALGLAEREPDWQALFVAEISDHGWMPALDTWAARLAPGFAASAAHGVIRTAHAARALCRGDTAPRRRELAAGLALWAVGYQPLPGSPLSANGSWNAGAALGLVPLVPKLRRRNGGAITAALAVLDEQPGFADSLLTLNARRPMEVLIADLATAFAQEFLEQVRSPLHAIVFTHAITGIAAAQRLGHCVSDATARALIAYAWQTGCALHAVYAEQPLPIPAVQPLRPEALIDAAVNHGDEHVIKLTEVCLDFHSILGDDVFLAVAARACRAIPRP